MRKCRSALRAKAITAPQLFQGHTRFATSSIAALPGCHPHQWCKPSTQVVWTLVEGEWSAKRRNVESYITHNGDRERARPNAAPAHVSLHARLCRSRQSAGGAWSCGTVDFLNLHGIVYPLEDVQAILVAILHSPLPATVDSVCVAGLLDLLRTAGLSSASVRYGYLFGALRPEFCPSSLPSLATRGQLWSESTLRRAAAIFEAAWGGVVAKLAAAADARRSEKLRAELVACLSEGAPRTALEALPMPSGCREPRAALNALVRCAVDAFFDQGLLAASRQVPWPRARPWPLHARARGLHRTHRSGPAPHRRPPAPRRAQLLGSAMGSFGLVLSHSLDASRELVVAARGQTMSVAFYPETGLVMFGSESAATKAGMTLPRGAAPDPRVASPSAEHGASMRLDMDDVNGAPPLAVMSPTRTPPLAMSRTLTPLLAVRRRFECSPCSPCSACSPCSSCAPVAASCGTRGGAPVAVGLRCRDVAAG